MMMVIERLTTLHYPAIKQIVLSEQQNKFSANGEQFLSALEPSDNAYVIKADELIIGFFKIDTQFNSRYDFCKPASLGLRSFTIDPIHQGKGFGKQSVRCLLQQLPKLYSNHDCIYLTVNCKNPAAHHCYNQAGFIDTNELYHGGSAGPQHIMYARLSNL